MPFLLFLAIIVGFKLYYWVSALAQEEDDKRRSGQSPAPSSSTPVYAQEKARHETEVDRLVRERLADIESGGF